MSINALSGSSGQQLQNFPLQMGVAVVSSSLDQQKLLGQAVLKLLDSAAVSFDPNVGQNINIYV